MDRKSGTVRAECTAWRYTLSTEREVGAARELIAMSDHDDAHIAETKAVVAELEHAGLVTVARREDGEPSMC